MHYYFIAHCTLIPQVAALMLLCITRALLRLLVVLLVFSTAAVSWWLWSWCQFLLRVSRLTFFLTVFCRTWWEFAHL